MKRSALICLTASVLLLFAACSNHAEKDDERETESQPQETVEDSEEKVENQAEKMIELSENEQQLWDERQKIIENWEFPDYFIVEGAHYEELYQPRIDIYVDEYEDEAYEKYKIQPMDEVYGNYIVRPMNVENMWYGVPGFFPFVTLDDQVGLLEQSIDAALDEGTAICYKYFTAALEYNSNQDQRFFVEQRSNYSHYSIESWSGSTDEGDTRWFWLSNVEANYFGFEDLLQPDLVQLEDQPYKKPISLDVAIIDSWREPDDLKWRTMTFEERLVHQYEQMEMLGELEELTNSYFLLSGLTILNGDSRTEESYFAGSRAKNIRITVNGEYTKELCLADTPTPQLISLDYMQNTITKPVHIEIEVLDSYAGATDKIYITEVGVGIHSNIHQWL